MDVVALRTAPTIPHPHILTKLRAASKKSTRDAMLRKAPANHWTPHSWLHNLNGAKGYDYLRGTATCLIQCIHPSPRWTPTASAAVPGGWIYLTREGSCYAIGISSFSIMAQSLVNRPHDISRLVLAPSPETVSKYAVLRIRIQTAGLVKVLDCLSLVLSDLPRNLYKHRDHLIPSVASVE